MAIGTTAAAIGLGVGVVAVKGVALIGSGFCLCAGFYLCKQLTNRYEAWKFLKSGEGKELIQEMSNNIKDLGSNLAAASASDAASQAEKSRD